MAHDGELAARAIAAAEYLFEEDDPDEIGGLFEPSDERTAKTAVTRVRRAVRWASWSTEVRHGEGRNSGIWCPVTRCRAWRKIVQNADDVEATEIVLQLSPRRASGEP